MENHRYIFLPVLFSMCLVITFAAAQKRSSGQSSKKKKPMVKTEPVSKEPKDLILLGNRTPSNASGDPDSADEKSAGAKIDENLLRAHIKFLADDLLEGRGPGSRGGMIAAKYIAANFESL